ncbi:MAG TPA: hypothetical protein VEU06_01205 [Micropepsaceae bacterium]|nr:hypothetical protein [Micropepsaceae bacterium]
MSIIGAIAISLISAVLLIGVGAYFYGFFHLIKSAISYFRALPRDAGKLRAIFWPSAEDLRTAYLSSEYLIHRSKTARAMTLFAVAWLSAPVALGLAGLTGLFGEIQ